MTPRMYDNAPRDNQTHKEALQLNSSAGYLQKTIALPSHTEPHLQQCRITEALRHHSYFCRCNYTLMISWHPMKIRACRSHSKLACPRPKGGNSSWSIRAASVTHHASLVRESSVLRRSLHRLCRAEILRCSLGTADDPEAVTATLRHAPKALSIGLNLMGAGVWEAWGLMGVVRGRHVNISGQRCNSVCGSRFRGVLGG